MRTKKLIAPIIITVLLVLFFLGVCAACFLLVMPLFERLLGLVTSVALIGVSVFVLVERISEIMRGEEDDLSNY